MEYNINTFGLPVNVGGFISLHYRKLVLILALGVTAFWPTLRVGFMIDDPFLIRATERDPGLHWKGLKSDLTEVVHKETGTYYYRPVLSLMVRVEHFFWDQRPLGYHVVSLLFHLSNAIMIFVLFSLLGFEPLVSFIVASLFAVNPVIVDDLMAATGGESMANFFLLATLLLCLKNRGWPALLLSFPALFSKESNIVLPGLFLLCLFLQKRLRENYLQLLWMLPAVGAFLVLRSRVVPHMPESLGTQTLPFLFLALPRIVFHYLRVLYVPLGLETWPPIFHLSHFWPVYLAVLGVFLAGLLFIPRHRTVILFCLGWFVFTFATRIPAMMLNQVMMDKWIFMSSPVLFLPMAAMLARLWNHPRPFLRWASKGFFIFGILFWITLVHLNVDLRGSDEKNYRVTVREGPRGFASYRLGIILMQSGRAEEAVLVMEPLPALYPESPDYQNGYALALWDAGRRQEGFEKMKALVKKFPDYESVSKNAQRMEDALK